MFDNHTDEEIDPLDVYGIRRSVVFEADRLVIRATQDVEPILDRNKELANSGDRGFTPSGNLRYVAEVPNIVIEDWLNKYGVNLFDPNHAPAVKRLLNSNEYAYLRTAPGHIG